MWMGLRIFWNDTNRVISGYSKEKNCPRTVLSTTNLTWNGLSSLQFPAVNHVRAIWHSVRSLCMKAGHVFAAFHFILQGRTSKVRSFWFHIAKVMHTDTQFTYGNETVILILVMECGIHKLRVGVGESFYTLPGMGFFFTAAVFVCLNRRKAGLLSLILLILHWVLFLCFVSSSIQCHLWLGWIIIIFVVVVYVRRHSRADALLLPTGVITDSYQDHVTGYSALRTNAMIVPQIRSRLLALESRLIRLSPCNPTLYSLSCIFVLAVHSCWIYILFNTLF